MKYYTTLKNENPHRAYVDMLRYKNRFPFLLKGPMMISSSVPCEWEAIVLKLCEDIEKIIESHVNLFNIDNLPYCVQIKDKFNYLRFYMNYPSRETAEDLSMVIAIEGLITGAEEEVEELNKEKK